MSIDEGQTGQLRQRHPHHRAGRHRSLESRARPRRRRAAALLEDNVGAAARIEHAELPFTIQVLRWLPNSPIRAAPGRRAEPRHRRQRPAAASPTKSAARPASTASRASIFPPPTSSCSPKIAASRSARILFGPELTPQTVEVDGKTFDVALRHKRIYYPYTLTLKDFRFDRYTGTNTPKNYSSLVQLQDPAHNVDREVPIWMNNPLRYAGTTFYQADWDKRTEQGTVLQVVKNPGWMTPYVACMLVVTGMLAHFGVVLARFLRAARHSPRRAGFSPRAGTHAQASTFALLALPRPGRRSSSPATSAAKPACRIAPPSEMQVYEFGKLPLAYQGRIKPYDTVARNTLQILSGRQEVIGKRQRAGSTS